MKITKENQPKVVIGVLAAGVVTWLLFKNSADNGKGYGDDPTGNNPGATSTTLDVKLAVDKLYNAMREIGTDEKAIMQVFQTVSLGNFSKVYHAFGKRSYNTQLGNQYNFNPFFSLPLYNLSEWLENELSKASFQTLRTKYQSTNLI